MIKVMVADDHGVFRDGLRVFLQLVDGISVVAEASDGNEAVRLAVEHRPDVILMDLAMPNLNGIEATRSILAQRPHTLVVMLSAYGSYENVAHALEAGAVGYVLKESGGREVVEAIRAVRTGRRFLSPTLNGEEIDQYLRREANKPSGPFGLLSSREREVLQGVVEGRTRAEVAMALGVSPRTVETHRTRIMQKLGVRTIAGLVKLAVQHGVTPSGGNS